MSNSNITLAQLSAAPPSELEQIYAHSDPIETPGGLFRGRHLCWIDAPNQHPIWRPLEQLGFAHTPFGIDFEWRHWFLFHRRLTMGRFTLRPGKSRWRDTDTLQLHYQVSHLPSIIRTFLYDEVKPLTSELCLGLGGISAPSGTGDHFFFALSRSER